VGEYPSLALDYLGNPHISFYDRTNGDLLYTHKSGATWITEVADVSTDDTGQYTALALDAHDNPHISFYDVTNGRLKYAAKSAGTWNVEMLDDSSPGIGKYSSIAIDGAGNPRISYYDAFYGDLSYVHKLAGAWEILYVDLSLNDVGQYSSIALDAGGAPHFSYYDQFNNLLYAYGPTESLAGVGMNPLPHAMALSLQPNPSTRGTRILLGRDAAASTTRIEIYDVHGRLERRLAVDGSGAVTWDGRDESGAAVQPGVHLVRTILANGASGPGQRLVTIR